MSLLRKQVATSGRGYDYLQNTVPLVPNREIMDLKGNTCLLYDSPVFSPVSAQILFSLREFHIHKFTWNPPACVEMYFRKTHLCFSFLGSQCPWFSYVAQNPTASQDFAPIPLSVNSTICAYAHAALWGQETFSLMEVSHWVSIPSQIHSHILEFQFSSVDQSCPTLCDPMNHRTPGLPVHHQLPESTQTHVHRVSDAIQPPHPSSVIFSSCRQSFPASGSFQMSQLFSSGGQSIGVSASTSLLPMNIQR